MQVAQEVADATKVATASREAVAKGVALLDERLPGWAADVRPSLDINNPDTCVLGQLARNNAKLRGMIEARWNDTKTDDVVPKCTVCKRVHGACGRSDQPSYRYSTAARALGLGDYEGSLGSPREYGFDVHWVTGVVELNDEWCRVITERQAAA
jgi:hypothetical protein